MQDLNNNQKLPITAFVASCNEAALLKDCLNRLAFCSEIFVIDLSSTDNTAEVAKEFGAKILNYPRYPIVEQALHQAIPSASFDWILITDPDENIDDKLSDELRKVFDSIEQYHAIRVPVQFYFKKHPLKGTVWGGFEKDWRLLFNKHYFKTSETVHEGIQLLPNAKTLTLKRIEPEMVIHHYWMTSYKSLFEKHNRYIKQEGRRLYVSGNRYTLKNHIKITLNSFRGCFFSAKGYKDNITGLFLSFFWAYYNFMCWSSLFQYQKNHLKRQQ